MTGWLLVMVLHFQAGIAREPVVLHGERPYLSVQDCESAGRLTAEWLQQDFMTVTYRCDPTTSAKETS